MWGGGEGRSGEEVKGGVGREEWGGVGGGEGRSGEEWGGGEGRRKTYQVERGWGNGKSEHQGLHGCLNKSDCAYDVVTQQF